MTTPTFKESRLKNGTLKLGTAPSQMDFSCQITNCRVISNYDDDGDAVTVLCGTTIAAPRKSSGHQLAGTLVQDFDSATSTIAWLWAHDLQLVDFTFTPNNVAQGVTIAGKVQIEVPNDGTYGGDVGARLTTDFTWNMQTAPTFTYATTEQAAAEPAA